MRIISESEELFFAKLFIDQAVIEARRSSCFRSKCGSVIVDDKTIIGSGYNSAPRDVKLESCLKDSLPQNFKSDKTCCVHAEQRAIYDALARNSERIQDSRLYFIRLDDEGEKKVSGDPYCTICSKSALDVGVGEFVLFKAEGICVYDTLEYNRLSFEFGK
jgi:dCMP deaminase